MDVFICKLAFYLLIIANLESHGALISYTAPREVSELENYSEGLKEARHSLSNLIMKWFTDSSKEALPKVTLSKFCKTS